MRVVLLSADLMMQSRIGGALAAAGIPLQTAMSAAKLHDMEMAGAVVVLDLATPDTDAALVASLRGAASPPKAIVAFGPHVLEAQLQAARAAGCDGVFARGQFLASAASIIRELGSR